VRIDRRQQFSQSGADPAGSTGHQYAWHFIPRVAVRNQYGALAAVRQVITRNTNTTVIPRESGGSSNH
ncbi:MAG TPA: hypothetical protein VK561_01965, partial [Bradyrhizobium sp.]|nr:hypothetical protein [Bradyrhizobium sp.]